MNSNRTIVKSFANLQVNFSDPYELNKVYIVKNLGIIHDINKPPANYKGVSPIWNLNLPIFVQKEGWEINVFQSNYKKYTKPGATIIAGTKSLTFLGLSGSSNSTSSSGSSKALKKDPKVSATQLGKEDIKKELESDANKTRDGGAIFLYKDSETGIKQKFVFNLRYYKGAGGGAYGEPHDGMYEFAVLNETSNSTAKAGKKSPFDSS